MKARPHSLWRTSAWQRQEGGTQRSLSPAQSIIVHRLFVAMVFWVGQLVWLAGMELVLARLVALDFFGKESHSARLGACAVRQEFVASTFFCQSSACKYLRLCRMRNCLCQF